MEVIKLKVENYLHSWSIYLLPGPYCHAIWQHYKKLEGVFASIEFQN